MHILNGVLATPDNEGQFFVFNADSSKWRPLKTIQPYGTLARYVGVGFTINGLGYIATGSNCSRPLLQVWEYHTTTDLWNQITPINLENGPAECNWACSWSTSEENAFLGFGVYTNILNQYNTYYSYFDEMWKFLPTNPYNSKSNL